MSEYVCVCVGFEIHTYTKAFVSENVHIQAELAINARLYEHMPSILFVGVYYGQRACLPVRG